MLKPPLTEERWKDLLRHQHEREVQERERIRRAVAASEVPLNDELVQAVVSLSNEHSRNILREHPGFAFAERRNSYLTSLSIMELSLADLLCAINDFEQDVIRDDSTLFEQVNAAVLEAVEHRIQKELFAAANAAASLVDHSRRMQKRLQISGYNEKLHACFGVDGLHDLVIGLRVLLHHLHVIEAGWNMRTSFEDGKSATFAISKSELLRAIAQFPERFGGKKGEPLLSYVKAANEWIDLRAIFEDYRDRVTQFHYWLREELASSPSLMALRDYDRCLREKKNFGVRMAWNMLLGNWLRNWAVPPNPHNYLHKYLTPEQLVEVYKLPRNSTAQVDLVISYVDTDHAIDDKLRRLAYELFERSPPESRSDL